ncbi:hypothetical protein EHS19_04885 [Bifidobacterium jacchi]|uniref:Uncharacterized protein n=1 Tax=Bifidobacterium jacchi TaxID=2490545 RepID=A0A5N5RJW7_9BIFI|nr:hypothetical protein EHS19_04885 [Bifidobacterium jacchi]
MPVSWPVGQLIGWPVGQLASWPVGRLASWPADRLASWPVGLLACWPVGLLAGWPVGRLINRSHRAAVALTTHNTRRPAHGGTSGVTHGLHAKSVMITLITIKVIMTLLAEFARKKIHQHRSTRQNPTLPAF